jgi:DNA invertase Pin-like site-specific DNA recombinase
MTTVGYARVSTQDQNTDLQRDALTQAGCGKIFEDKASGADPDRPQLKECLRYLQSGDVLIIWKLDRLGRSLGHLIDVIEYLRERGVAFRSLTDPIDTTTPAGMLIFQVFGAVAQFERSLNRERVSAGLAAARARGRVGGRRYAHKRDKRAEIAAAAKRYNISVSTVGRYITETESEYG